MIKNFFASSNMTTFWTFTKRFGKFMSDIGLRKYLNEVDYCKSNFAQSEVQIGDEFIDHIPRRLNYSIQTEDDEVFGDVEGKPRRQSHRVYQGDSKKLKPSAQVSEMEKVIQEAKNDQTPSFSDIITESINVLKNRKFFFEKKFFS